MTTGNESPQSRGGEADAGRADESAAARPASVYLGLGSNLGDREANLREAVERIKGLGLEVVRFSSIYETEPVGYADQPWFLNQVIEARVAPDLTFNADEETIDLLKMTGEYPSETARLQAREMIQVQEMLRALHGIEDEMGRARVILNGPRVIDIDILLFSDVEGIIASIRTVGNSAGRNVGRANPIIPHPRMHKRRFVLEPLCEIAPDLVYPPLKMTCREMLAALDDPLDVRVYKRGGRDSHP
ncbi:MAG TPA: 2-amino-4-hydroxy-6-hydroxymethyldihydropteridine diphosphokinase [Blastocatellia bacterium]|jgi:2-amino-4-hydroxy-6-hydroxymethyldihydropteridine diphosphokinase